MVDRFQLERLYKPPLNSHARLYDDTTQLIGKRIEETYG